MGYTFKNCLDVDVDIYFQTKDEQGRRCTRGAGPSGTTGYLSRVESKDELPLDTNDLGEEFQLRVKIDQVSVKGNVMRLKIVPGTGLGFGHHIEFHQIDDLELIIIHYKTNKDLDDFLESSKFVRDVDPRIEHPDPPET